MVMLEETEWARQKLPLHMAKSLKELEGTGLVPKNTYARKLDMLFRVSDTIYRKAVETQNKEPVDEEQVYIFCLRYLELTTHIKTQFNDDNFHKSRFSKFITQIQTIKNNCELSLNQRYGKKEPFKTISSDIVEPIDEMNLKLNASKLFTKDDDVFVDAHTLYRLMNYSGLELLIMDLRSSFDQQESSLKYKRIVNIADEAVRKGLTTNTLQKYLSGDNLEVFKARHSFDVIVLMDLETTRISYRTSKVESLRSILIEWDMDEKYRSLPIVLDGGLRAFAENYPTYVSNPTSIFNKIFDTLDEFLNDVSYPDIHQSDNVPEIPIKAAEPDFEVSRPNDQPTSMMMEISVTPIDSTHKASTILQNILVASECQLDVEVKMVNLVKQRLMLLQEVAQDRRSVSAISSEMETLGEDISKAESFRIEIDERRTILDSAYKNLIENLAVSNLDQTLQDIQTSDRKRLLQYQARKKLEQEVLQMMKVVDYKISKAPARNNVTPQIPDRKSKPSEDCMRLIELYKDKFQDTGLTGLSNIKNTCYLNSLLQCLRAIPIIISHYFGGTYSPKTPLSFFFMEMIRSCWRENEVVLRPTNFYSEVCRKDNGKKGYINGSHEDVQEFYLFVTKALHEEICRPINVNNEEITDKLKDWCKMFKGKNSFVNRAFYYQMEMTTTCPRCNISLVKFDYGNTLFISCPENGMAVSLEKRIKHFTTTTVDEQKACKFCNKCEVQLVLKKRISYYPAILAVNIVRYDFSKIEQCILRRDNQCIFQHEVQFGQLTYHLKSVSLHSGNRDVGHYTALCLHPFKNKWIEFNDEQYKYVNPNDIIYKVKSYMFFYALKQDFNSVNTNFF